jgi:hypothetical protein
MRAVVVWLAVLVLALGASARLTGGPLSPEEREAAAVGHEILCYRTVRALQLTPAQQEKLLPVLRTHVNDLITLREAQGRCQPALEPAMTGLRTAVVANNGVSDEVKAKVYRAEAAYKILDEKLEKALPDRAMQAWGVLTTAQGARLRRIASYGQDDEAVIKTIAAYLPQENRRADERVLGTIYRLYGLRDLEIPRAVAAGMPALKEWTLLQKGDAFAQREACVRRLLQLPETGILVERPDPLTQRFIAGTLLTQKTLHLLDPTVPLPPTEDIESPALKATVNDIRVLNLVNTLYLTPEQTKALIDLGTQANAEDTARRERRQTTLRAALPALRQARDAYAAGREPEPAVKAQLAALEQQRRALQEEDDKQDAKYLAQLKPLLTENQVTMIANFVPCTVPVQSLTNPERVGQANDNSGMERALERLRDTPESQLPRAISRLQDMIKAQFERKHYRPEKIEPVLEKVPEIVRDIRLMDDTEFALQKADLAASLAVPDHIAAGRELDERITTYLLAPNLKPLLQQRMAG